jgi:hypothetical protein
MKSNSYTTNLTLSINFVKLGSVGVSKPRGSLDRRVNCRRVPQPRWVDARQNAKGGEAAGGRQAWEVEPAAFVLAPRPGRVRLQ